MGEIVRVFSALALITSFLGVMLGVFEGLGDLFKRLQIATQPFNTDCCSIYSTTCIRLVLS